LYCEGERRSWPKKISERRKNNKGKKIKKLVRGTELKILLKDFASFGEKGRGKRDHKRKFGVQWREGGENGANYHLETKGPRDYTGFMIS